MNSGLNTRGNCLKSGKSTGGDAAAGPFRQRRPPPHCEAQTGPPVALSPPCAKEDKEASFGSRPFTPLLLPQKPPKGFYLLNSHSHQSSENRGAKHRQREGCVPGMPVYSPSPSAHLTLGHHQHVTQPRTADPFPRHLCLEQGCPTSQGSSTSGLLRMLGPKGRSQGHDWALWGKPR